MQNTSAGILLYNTPQSAFHLISTNIWLQFSSYSLSVIPLYIFMGEIIYRSGIAEKLLNTAYVWIGSIKGGMASTTILASSGFASICGSNTATTAAMGTMALPILKKYNYNTTLSVGSIAAGGTLGIIFPPSTVLLIIALQTEQSIGALFIASVIPALLLTLLMIITVRLICYFNPMAGPEGPKTSMLDKVVSFKEILPVLLLFSFVIGGLYLGWFTPTESGAFGSFGAIVIALLMRRLKLSDFVNSIKSTLISSSMVILLITGAVVFGKFLTMTRFPFTIAEWVSDLSVPAVITLSIILIIYVIGGSFMDAIGFLVLTLPIFYPILSQLGYSSIWISVVLCVVTSLGAITPPVGVNIFVVKGLSSEISITTIFKGASYFIISYIVFLVLITIFPKIVTFLV